MNDAYSYADGHSLEAAALWVQSLILGQVGTMVAVLAIAIVGFNMLRGSMAARDGIRALLGCFILFGAPVIAKGLTGALPRSAEPEVIVPIQPPIPSPQGGKSLPSHVNPFDPYTGTSSPATTN